MLFFIFGVSDQLATSLAQSTVNKPFVVVDLIEKGKTDLYWDLVHSLLVLMVNSSYHLLLSNQYSIAFKARVFLVTSLRIIIIMRLTYCHVNVHFEEVTKMIYSISVSIAVYP